MLSALFLMKMKKGGVRKLSAKSIREAGKIVLGGGVIVYPTDTVYGLGCDPMNELAAERLFTIKGRGGKPVPSSVIASSRPLA